MRGLPGCAKKRMDASMAATVVVAQTLCRQHVLRSLTLTTGLDDNANRGEQQGPSDLPCAITNAPPNCINHER